MILLLIIIVNIYNSELTRDMKIPRSPEGL